MMKHTLTMLGCVGALATWTCQQPTQVRPQPPQRTGSVAATASSLGEWPSDDGASEEALERVAAIADEAITADGVFATASELADPNLGGRAAGTRQARKASSIVADALHAAG